MINNQGSWNDYLLYHHTRKISEQCLDDYMKEGFSSKEIAKMCDMVPGAINIRIRKKGGTLHVSRAKNFGKTK